MVLDVANKFGNHVQFCIHDSDHKQGHKLSRSPQTSANVCSTDCIRRQSELPRQGTAGQATYVLHYVTQATSNQTTEHAHACHLYRLIFWTCSGEAHFYPQLLNNVGYYREPSIISIFSVFFSSEKWRLFAVSVRQSACELIFSRTMRRTKPIFPALLHLYIRWKQSKFGSFPTKRSG